MRLIIKNLPPNTTSETITALFTKFGTITDIYFMPDKNRRFCFVGYKNNESATSACKTMNKFYMKNYRLTVEKINENNEINNNYNNINNNNNNNNINNISNIGNKIRKLNKHDKEFDNANNTLIIEGKQEKIVNSSEVQDNKKIPIIYSDIIKIINIPECTNESDLKEVFPNIRKITLNTDNSAILEFESLEDSVSAQGLVRIFLGKRVKYVKHVIHEIGYNSLFFDFATVIERICAEEKLKKSDLVDLKDKNLGSRVAILETHLVEQTKNWLNTNNIKDDGKVNQKALIIKSKELMKLLGTLKYKKVTLAPNNCVALVYFEKEIEAKEVLKNIIEYNTSRVYCQYAKIGTQEKVVDEILKCTTNKILVKNVPFQANESDILVLLKSQVQVKTVRMPVKKDGSKKGFAFVELESLEEANLVMQYFGRSTHLFGRRLVFLPAES